jgi:hypothetical protein
MAEEPEQKRAPTIEDFARILGTTVEELKPQPDETKEAYQARVQYMMNSQDFSTGQGKVIEQVDAEGNKTQLKGWPPGLLEGLTEFFTNPPKDDR